MENYNLHRLNLPAILIAASALFGSYVDNWIPLVLSMTSLMIIVLWLDSAAINRMHRSLVTKYGPMGNTLYLYIYLGVLFPAMVGVYIATKPFIYTHLLKSTVWEDQPLLVFLVSVAFPIAMLSYVIRRLIRLRGNKMFLECGLYFGYGAFSSQAELERFIPAVYNLGKHELYEYKSGYCVVSKNRQHVTFGIEKDPKSYCVGRLYFIDNFTKLDAVEGKGRYRRKLVFINRWIPAYVYIPLETDWHSGLEPTPQYQQIIEQEIYPSYQK